MFALLLACSVARADPEAAVVLLSAAAKAITSERCSFTKRNSTRRRGSNCKLVTSCPKPLCFYGTWPKHRPSSGIGKRHWTMFIGIASRSTPPIPEVNANAPGSHRPDRTRKTRAGRAGTATYSATSPQESRPHLGLGWGWGSPLIADIGVAAAGYQLSQSNEGAMLTMAELADLNMRGNTLNTAGWSLLGLAWGLRQRAESGWRFGVGARHGLTHKTPRFELLFEVLSRAPLVLSQPVRLVSSTRWNPPPHFCNPIGHRYRTHTTVLAARGAASLLRHIRIPIGRRISAEPAGERVAFGKVNPCRHGRNGPTALTELASLSYCECTRTGSHIRTKIGSDRAICAALYWR